MRRTSVLVLSPSFIELSRLIRVISASRPDCLLSTTADLSTAKDLMAKGDVDILLISRLMAQQPDLDAARALAQDNGVLWAPLHGQMAHRPRDAASSEFLDGAEPPGSVQCLEELLAIIDARCPTGERIPRSPRPTGSRRADGAGQQAHPRGGRRSEKTSFAANQPVATGRCNNRIVVMGASTGGVEALASVLEHFPPDCPPTVIVQHTGRGYSASLVRVLARRCAAKVFVAEDQLLLEPGIICVGGGLDGHLHLQPTAEGLLRCSILPGPDVCGQTPSIDVLFRSVVPLAARVIAVLLTGMGSDGAEGLLDLRKAGAATIGQDAATSVVYGMPRVAFEIGAVRQQLPLSQIGPAILRLAKAGDAASRMNG